MAPVSKPHASQVLPMLRDGSIRLDELRRWGAEFDRIDPRRYAALDFVSWIEINVEADAVRRREQHRHNAERRAAELRP